MLIYGGVKSWSFVGFTLEAKRRALNLIGTGNILIFLKVPPPPPPPPQLYAILKAPFEVAYAQDSFENLQLKGDGAWFVTISTQASS